jgi:type IV secretory pathway TrbL component
MSTIENIEIFPIISLSIFVGFFAILLYRVARMKKNEIKELENIPLED